MADQNTAVESPKAPAPSTSKGIPAWAKVAIGCVIVLFVLGIIVSVVVGWFIKKAGKTILEKTIENQTGIKADISEKNGTMTYTDEKTGTKVDFGSGKVPDSFPKDFPIYPGSTVTSSLSGTGQEAQSGFWLTLTSPDSMDKVTEYYKTNLKTNGWNVSGTSTTEESTTIALGKGLLEGTVTIDRAADAKETTILIVLGSGSATPVPTEESPAQ